MKKHLLIALIVVGFAKVLIADMDTEGIIGRNVSIDIEKCFVVEIKNKYCNSSFNILYNIKRNYGE